MIKKIILSIAVLFTSILPSYSDTSISMKCDVVSVIQANYTYPESEKVVLNSDNFAINPEPGINVSCGFPGCQIDIEKIKNKEVLTVVSKF